VDASVGMVVLPSLSLCHLEIAVRVISLLRSAA
jgi:hypothetical protein